MRTFQRLAMHRTRRRGLSGPDPPDTPSRLQPVRRLRTEPPAPADGTQKEAAHKDDLPRPRVPRRNAGTGLAGTAQYCRRTAPRMEDSASRESPRTLRARASPTPSTVWRSSTLAASSFCRPRRLHEAVDDRPRQPRAGAASGPSRTPRRSHRACGGPRSPPWPPRPAAASTCRRPARPPAARRPPAPARRRAPGPAHRRRSSARWPDGCRPGRSARPRWRPGRPRWCARRGRRRTPRPSPTPGTRGNGRAIWRWSSRIRYSGRTAGPSRISYGQPWRHRIGGL
ncbi:hypothetical protein SMICM17S_08642 [Streptomyces microflavus]